MDEVLDLSLPSRKKIECKLETSFGSDDESTPARELSRIHSLRDNIFPSFSNTMRLPTTTQISPPLRMDERQILSGPNNDYRLSLPYSEVKDEYTNRNQDPTIDEYMELKFKTDAYDRFNLKISDFNPVTLAFKSMDHGSKSSPKNRSPVTKKTKDFNSRSSTPENRHPLNNSSPEPNASPSKRSSCSDSDSELRTPSPKGASPSISSPPLDSTITKTVSGITISLDDSDLWNTFRKNGTEMIINRNGRRMFPHLDLSIQGLNPTRLYNILLDVCPADDKRYKFIGNKWTSMGMADPMVPNAPILHRDSPNIGSFWMRNLSFAKVKLTNHKDFNKEDMIVLQSMHKYMIKVIIESAGSDGKGLQDRVVIPLEETAFYAVTAYQNETIIQLKIHNNPFAKAFRDNRVQTKTKSNRNLLSPKSARRYSIVDSNDGDKIKNKRRRQDNTDRKTSHQPDTQSSPTITHFTDSPELFQHPRIQPYFGLNGLPFMPFGGMPSYPIPPFMPPMLYPPPQWVQSEQYPTQDYDPPKNEYTALKLS